MSEAEPGDTVRIEYEGRKADDEEIIGSSQEQDGPLEFTLGNGEVIPGLEEAVAGMEPGERKEVEVPPPLAYGERDEERQAKVPRSALPPGYDPEPGDILEVERDDGARYPVTVQETEGEDLVVDENHPLAGKTLEFDVELVEVLEGAAEAAGDLEPAEGPDAPEDTEEPEATGDTETPEPSGDTGEPEADEETRDLGDTEGPDDGPEPGPDPPEPDGPGELVDEPG